MHDNKVNVGKATLAALMKNLINPDEIEDTEKQKKIESEFFHHLSLI